VDEFVTLRCTRSSEEGTGVFLPAPTCPVELLRELVTLGTDANTLTLKDCGHLPRGGETACANNVRESQVRCIAYRRVCVGTRQFGLLPRLRMHGSGVPRQAPACGCLASL
jgi:hypothetical protein